jgi:hypothetical protein
MTKSFFALLGKILAGLVTILALFHAVENFRGARAWQAERQRLEALGEELSWARLMPAAPRPKAISTGPTMASDAAQWRRPDFLEAPGFRRDFVDPWLVAGPDGRVRVEHWRSLLLKPAPRRDSETPCAAGAAFLVALLPLDPVIERMVEAARVGPIAEWNIQPGTPPSSTVTPPLLAMRRLGKLLRLRIAAHFSCGAADRAADEIRVLARLTHSLDGLPFAITCMMKMALADDLLDSIHDGLARGQLDARRRAEVASLMEDGWFASARLALRAERNWLIFHAESPHSFVATGRYATLGEILMPHGWQLRQAIHIARFTEEALGLLADPTRLDPVAITGLPHGQNERFTPYNGVARMIEMSLERIARSAGALQTRVQLTRIAFALTTYREKSGAYPSSLSDMPQDEWTPAPIDIVTGGRLQYRRTEHGFSLYSVGWDLKDDGASPEPHLGFASSRDWSLVIDAR